MQVYIFFLAIFSVVTASNTSPEIEGWEFEETNDIQSLLSEDQAESTKRQQTTTEGYRVTENVDDTETKTNRSEKLETSETLGFHRIFGSPHGYDHGFAHAPLHGFLPIFYGQKFFYDHGYHYAHGYPYMFYAAHKYYSEFGHLSHHHPFTGHHHGFMLGAVLPFTHGLYHGAGKMFKLFCYIKYLSGQTRDDNLIGTPH